MAELDVAHTIVAVPATVDPSDAPRQSMAATSRAHCAGVVAACYSSWTFATGWGFHGESKVPRAAAIPSP